jgi:hypothetical protein
MKARVVSQKKTIKILILGRLKAFPVPLMCLLTRNMLCRGSCFFGYTAENSHHLKARIISKDPLFK